MSFRERLLVSAATNERPYKQLRCNKKPYSHFGFEYAGQPCIKSCGGNAAWYWVNPKDGMITPA